MGNELSNCMSVTVGVPRPLFTVRFSLLHTASVLFFCIGMLDQMCASSTEYKPNCLSASQ